MRAQRRFASGLVALCAVLTLAGCGGGGGSGGGGSPANRAPSAKAGPDQTAKRNATVTLDGSASADADGDSLAYRWVQTSGTPVTLSSSTSSRPTFTAPTHSGSLGFALTTNDGKVDSTTDAVTVTVQNTAPVAVSTQTLTVGLGQLAVLDGSSSTDADGDPLTYTWTQLSGAAMELSNIAPGVSQFRVPSTPQEFTFSLTVNDGEATSTTINVSIHVTVAATPPLPPTVSAGNDADVARRSLVALTGSAWDLNGDAPLSYSWEQTAGVPVTLSNAHSSSAMFTAPETATQLRFALRASDGALTSEADEVTINVRNFAPTVSNATISPAAAYTADTLVADVQANDADHDAVNTTYEWRRNGTPVSGQTSNTFPASLTTKNDVIAVRMTVDDGEEQVTVDASTVILDSPAVLSAQTPAPTALNYGDTANFTVTATDADGDPITGYEVAFGPAGFNVTPQGDVSWTAGGPLFDRTTDFNWGVRVIGESASLLSGTIKVTDAAREYPLRRTSLGTPVQHSGLRIGDLDGDGDGEILVGAAQAIYVLSKNGSTYQQSWVYPFDAGTMDFGYGNELQAVTAADINGDGRQEIYFSKAGQLVRLDGTSRREAASADVRCVGLEVADLDGNGTQELVCLGSVSAYPYESNGRIVVMNASTLAEIWSTPELAVGRSLAVGNVDADSALEIVTSGGFVYDSGTRQNQWTYSDQSVAAVDTGDLDGDGIGEIICATNSLSLRAYSAVARSMLWDFPAPFPFAAVTVADANGDGRLEAIVGSYFDEAVMAVGYNTATHQPEILWDTAPLDQGVSSIAVGDVDADGNNEVVWGAGFTLSTRDRIVIAGVTPAVAVKWQSGNVPELTGPFIGGELARIGGGATRLMFGVARSESFGGTRAIALTPMTGEVEVSDELGLGCCVGPFAHTVVDYDNNNIDELFIGDDHSFGIYDLVARSITWQSQTQASPQHGFIAKQADMNDDGFPDLVGLTDRGNVEIYDVHAGSVTPFWRSPVDFYKVGVALAVSDLDDDNEPEIIAMRRDRISVYDRSPMGTTFVERASIAHENAADLLVADLNGDSEPEIYVLNYPTTIYSTLDVFDADLQLVRSVQLNARGSALYVEQSTFARKNLLLAVTWSLWPTPISSNSELVAIDPMTGANVWHSPPLVGTVERDSLHFVDVDGDGDDEIAFGNNYGMYHTR